uniref:Intradiol ring-cleavage dioxygenases domain-containing protein n=2 Tax=Tetranychus urticae TaxID=32264 RepID=T1K9R9_TETUR
MLTVTLFANVFLVSSHSERSIEIANHDATVIDCARYKREANQHKCVITPFTTEGPYFLPDDYERSDITDGYTGVNLNLTLLLTNAKDCSPLSNYYVHIWNANALGHYSGVQEFNFFDHPTFRPKPINNLRFLRGYQITNEEGLVNFNTIIPGWYFGRCLHIHVEIYDKNTTDGHAISYIGQLYFNREMPAALRLIDPYSQNNNELTLNEQDVIYPLSRGSDTTLELIPEGNGFRASYVLSIDPTVKIENTYEQFLYDDAFKALNRTSTEH